MGAGSFGAASGSRDRNGAVLGASSLATSGLEAITDEVAEVGEFEADNATLVGAEAGIVGIEGFALLATDTELLLLFLDSMNTTTNPMPSRITLVDHDELVLGTRWLAAAGSLVFGLEFAVAGTGIAEVCLT